MKIILNNFLKKLTIKKIEEWITIFFFCASIFVLIFLTQALLLTWLNQFKIVYFLISLFISFLLTIIFLRFIKKDIKILPHLNIAVLSVIFLISLVLILFPHDCFGGRDEGAYSGMAIILSKYHSISIPSYLLKVPLAYGSPDKTLVLTTPAHVVWLATQKILFGTGWMLRSNVVLIFLGLCSLFLVSSLITKKSLAFITVLLFSTCMPFLWFSRETITENMAFFLLWFLILSLFLFIKTKKYYFLVGLFLSSWLFPLTRNEGLFIQIPVLVIFTTILLIRKIVPQKKIFFISIIYISLIVLSFLVNNRLLPLNKNTEVSGGIAGLTQQISKSNFVKLGNRMPVFVFQMTSKQNLSLALYSFFLVIILIIVSKKEVVKDKILYFCLLGIISVEFLKLINPSVTLEQPWMYRRYFYALLPFGYLNLSILLNKLVRQKLLVFLSCGLLITNIILSSKIITLKNNWLITEKIEKITRSITPDDFVIIKNRTILYYYYPGNFFAYHKSIRNLLSPWIKAGDWLPKEKKFQGMSYSRLFLLSDIENESYEGFKLKKIDAVEIESRQLQTNCELDSLKSQLEMVGSPYFLPYQDVISFCSKTDNEILEVKKKIFLYELIY